ncbi:MAG: rhodanese-like domain-containing protein [Thermodesulfobacteriota bacterium]
MGFWTRIPVLAALLAGLLCGQASAAGQPAWWADMAAEAQAGGYRLVDEAGLKDLMARRGDLVILDARPDYEFERGHIPGAVNLEFHLGDRLQIKPDKAERLRALLGPDLSRPVAVYCRSFR